MSRKVKLPVRRDIDMKRGQDWNWTIKLKNNDLSAKDTTNYQMTMTIKSAGVNGKIYDQLTIGDGITHTPGGGQFNLSIPYSDIDAFDFSSAEYDIIIVNTSNKHYCPFHGNITVIP